MLPLINFISEMAELLLKDPYRFVSSFDGTNIAPPVFCAFVLITIILGGRQSMGLFPYQPSIDFAFKYSVISDLVLWFLISYFLSDTWANLLSLFAPAGPLNMFAFFFPQQVLFTLALSFRREVPFLAIFSGTFILTIFTAVHTWFAWSEAVVPKDAAIGLISTSAATTPATTPAEVENYWFYNERDVCNHRANASLLLLATSVWMGLMVLFRTYDRLSSLLLVWATLGMVSYGNCMGNVHNKGGSVLLAQMAGLLIVKLQSDFKFAYGTALKDSIELKRKWISSLKAMNGDDIKKVALVLDGFIGPDAVICGISRTYEAWVHQLVKQGKEVILYTAFDADRMEAYFKKGGSIIKAYRLDSLDVKYVEQVYWATRTNWSNLRLLQRTLMKDQPDAVHVIFDGSSIPIFAWACAHMRIPIVGIMHTDTSVIMEKNGVGIVGKITIAGQKFEAAVIDSVATRSRSFGKRMVELHNWKCDHIIKPHVKTEIFYPRDAMDVRKKFMFNQDYDDPNKILLVYAGRLDLDKRVDELVKIVRQCKGVYLAIVGGGMMSSELEKLHGVKNRIYCKPGFVNQEQLANMYAAADLHISASQMETLGNTVLESLACGTPVITPRAQGFVDSIEHGVNGLMWKPDDLDDAVRLVKELRDDPALRKTLGDGAYASIKSLRVNATVNDLLNWYADASIIRRTNTFPIARLMACTFVLFQMVLFDKIVLPAAKRLLERFNDDKEERRKAAKVNTK